MRLNECSETKLVLEKHLGINLTIIDASKRFLDALAGVTDPEVCLLFDFAPSQAKIMLL